MGGIMKYSSYKNIWWCKKNFKIIVSVVIMLTSLTACHQGKLENKSENVSETATEVTSEYSANENVSSSQHTETEQTVEQTTVQMQNYPEYPIYVRTMGVGSVGCEYGYCELGEKSGKEILEELSEFSQFFNSPEYSEDVALFYDEEPQNIKLYHALSGATEYEIYPFAGEDYEYPWGVESQKYVIRVPKEYGTHYFFAVITWSDGKQDLMYFSMLYEGRDSKDMGEFKDLYNNLAINYCWPNGELLLMSNEGVLGGFGQKGNSYAIYDVDRDGQKEMVVNYSTTYSAGMITRIYDYDSESGEYILQYAGYVQNTYYDNGIIRADMSHNHSQGESIWPYDLYQYDPKTDEYKWIASACSQDKAWIGDNFDDAADKDGDGVLYLVTQGSADSEAIVLNRSEYEEWINSYVGDAKELEIRWKTLFFKE